MKKLISEVDFDDLEQLSKKWKKPVDEQSMRTSAAEPQLSQPSNNKENMSNNLPPEPTPIKKKLPEPQQLIDLDYRKQAEREKRGHMPHVIDEDTEHFKVRLEHLLNVFKTDAVSEFMSMKRSMLDDQKEQVRADTEKYLKMYEQKHEELVQTRDNLLAKTKECETKSAQIEAMASCIAKEKQRTRTVRFLATPFAMLIKYKEYREVKKFKKSQAEKANRKRLMRKALKGWEGMFRKQSKEKTKEENEKMLQNEMNEIANRYQKEMQMLREKLAEATSRNEEHQRNKQAMQDNLKKAFMKGICAMNFEAMNALQGRPGHELMEAEEFQQEKVDQALNHTMTANNMSMMPGVNPMSVSSLSFGKREEALLPNRSVIVLNQQKIESKEHKWREAPILGYEAADNDIQPIPSVPECMSVSGDQGKVIRVVNGRSTAATGKPGSQSPTPTKQHTSLAASKRTNGAIVGSRTPDTVIAAKKR